MYVIMLHSVGNHDSNWSRRYLSVSLDHFERLCQYISTENFTTHFLYEWYDYVSRFKKKDPQKIVLTFDDGYLDNWVYVYPMLKKYGLKGTIFINPEFVSKGQILRPNLDDLESRRISNTELETLGFLNWAEIKTMYDSGIIDIQSHSMSHNFYFCSDRIVDIYTGQQKYDWISWILYPDAKPFYMTEDVSKTIPFGYPVFQFDRSLSIKRYLPDNMIVEESVKIHAGSNTKKDEHLKQLSEILKRYPGRFENENETKTRYTYELVESKRIIEEKLNKRVDFLCWPGGGYNDLSFKIAIDAGYLASTLGTKSKVSHHDKDLKHLRIERFGLGSFTETRKGLHYHKEEDYLINVMKSRTGNQGLRVYLKLRKEMIQFLSRF